MRLTVITIRSMLQCLCFPNKRMYIIDNKAWRHYAREDSLFDLECTGASALVLLGLALVVPLLIYCS